MKGVILAGGKATRLRPLTYVTNKHLLPVYDKPMIFYPFESMKKAGIREVLVVTGPDHCGHFMNLLRSGRDFDVKISYEIQEEAGGLSQAVGLASQFADGESMLVILGDNIFTHDLGQSVQTFEQKGRGAKIFFKEMPNCQQYGVPEFDQNGKLIRVIEKPKNPPSQYAQTGIYIYDKHVFRHIQNLKPSARGELEITDLNNVYIDRGEMDYEIMDGWWIDAGTSYDELLKASLLVKEEVEKQGQRYPA